VSTVTKSALYNYPDLNDEEEAASKQLLTDMFVVPLDSRLARYAGYLRRLYRLKTPDSAIVATAMLTKTTLLTRNMDDFWQIDDLEGAGDLGTLSWRSDLETHLPLTCLSRRSSA